MTRNLSSWFSTEFWKNVSTELHLQLHLFETIRFRVNNVNKLQLITHRLIELLEQKIKNISILVHDLVGTRKHFYKIVFKFIENSEDYEWVHILITYYWVTRCKKVSDFFLFCFTTVNKMSCCEILEVLPYIVTPVNFEYPKSSGSCSVLVKFLKKTANKYPLCIDNDSIDHNL